MSPLHYLRALRGIVARERGHLVDATEHDDDHPRRGALNRGAHVLR